MVGYQFPAILVLLYRGLKLFKAGISRDNRREQVRFRTFGFYFDGCREYQCTVFLFDLIQTRVNTSEFLPYNRNKLPR